MLSPFTRGSRTYRYFFLPGLKYPFHANKTRLLYATCITALRRDVPAYFALHTAISSGVTEKTPVHRWTPVYNGPQVSGVIADNPCSFYPDA
ncbi:hypothetical protein B4100_2095 [Heyndrickxia coagulans]|jgi:hypothetical protein|nr:hypothetical protein B4100_2095 [Heyndrickxia coagulans]